MSIAVYLRTIKAIGQRNIFRALMYRVGVRSGLHPVLRVKPISIGRPFFRAPKMFKYDLSERKDWQTTGKAFGYWLFPINQEPPDWFSSPIDGERFPFHNQHWSKITDFGNGIDIKLIWELSRLDWVIAFAQHARAGKVQAINRLNSWLDDWIIANPLYRGPNWKCGQEASIRVMHLAVAAIILNQVTDPESGLLDLVRAHVSRISLSIGYALAQDNNHGTSEAAALFIGGTWITQSYPHLGHRWSRQGRKHLEERVARLIGEQGTFSQYSVNYHRVVLDTLVIAELWRQQVNAPAFTQTFYERAGQATRWLIAMIESTTGDAPNIGANDGARLIVLDDGPFRDFRVSAQRAAAVFLQIRPYPDAEVANESLHWLNIPIPKQSMPELQSWLADDGGFAMLRKGRARVILRYPRFRFRPSQADALHIDLWVDDTNVLRDSGTFSYRLDRDAQSLFTGVAGHNTVQFDGRDQMPRISRFLYGAWPTTIKLSPIMISSHELSISRAYSDRWGATHRRTIQLNDNSLTITDDVTGFRKNAVARWRYLDGALEPSGVTNITSDGTTISVSATCISVGVETVDSEESRHYFNKTSVKVLEVKISEPAIITTKIMWP